jgi:ATP-dependent Clp protease ATP-binding subunit ClpA
VALGKRHGWQRGRHFEPEFVNRIDEIVVFRARYCAQILAIAKIQLQRAW